MTPELDLLRPALEMAVVVARQGDLTEGAPKVRRFLRALTRGYEAARTNRWALVVPRLGSFIASGTWDSREVGLESFPPEDWPPVAIPFFTFRIMVGMGLLMLAVSWVGVLLRLLGRLDDSRWYLWPAFLSFPSGFVAVIAGWYTAEIGRQPWVIYGILRTEDAVNPSLAGPEVAISLAGYVLVYAVVYSFGLTYIYRLLRDGPQPTPTPERATARRPLAFAGADATGSREG